MSNEIAVQLSGVRRSYHDGLRDHLVLDSVSANFTRGETVAIRGRSGSGKSTLLNLIGGIDAPDAGTVMVDGIELDRLSERDRTLFRRKHIGFVYQAFNLISTITVADNIRLVLELNGVKGASASRRIDEMLTSVELEDRAASFPDVLSGGEQQRVAIARALCHSPPLLIADEPTGNLDDTTAETVLGLLDCLVRTAGGTMLIATHSARIAAYCDRTVEIHDGKLQPATAESHPVVA